MLSFLFESGASDEILFFQIDQFAKADFAGSEFLRRDYGALAGGVVDLDENEAGLDASDIECDHSGGMNVEGAPFGHQFIKNSDAIFPRHPDFVAEVAGVTRAGNVDRDAGDSAMSDSKIFEARDVRISDRVQQFAASWPLQSESGNLFRNVLDVHVEAKSILLEPAKTGVGGGPAIVVFAEAGDRAVVDDLAFGIAPATIDDLIDGNLIDVAANNAIDETGGIGTSDAILEKRRDIDKGGGVANGVVLVLVRHLVGADGVVAGPFLEVQAVAESESTFVESSSDGHKSSAANSE